MTGMAKEYIDKEAAIKLFSGDNQNKYYQFEVISRLRSIPTADVRENVKGRWIEDSDGDGRHCSVCGRDYCYLISDCETYIFCPNCGAQMGGAEDD